MHRYIMSVISEISLSIHQNYGTVG